MKKVLKTFLLTLVFALTGFAFVGCGEVVKLESIYVDLDGANKITVIVNTEWIPSEELIIKAKYSDNTEKIVDNDECDFSVIDTSVLGKQTLTITYLDEDYQVVVDIVNENETYNILSVQLPLSIQNFKSVEKNTYVSSDSTGKKGFEDIEQIYVVGNDNGFKFEPVALVSFGNGGVGSVTDYLRTVVVEMKQGETYSPVDTNYVTYNEETHTYLFKDSAIDNYFRITETVEKGDDDIVLSLDVKVIDAYNIYDAKELAILDNKNVEGKWTDYKNDYLEQTEIDLNKDINGIVLHNNITVTKDVIPEIHFYKENELLETDPDYDLAVGSLKDSTEGLLGFLYYRELQHGESFTIEGNYFQIDLSKMPLIVRAEGRVNTTNSAITTHTAVFGVFGVETDVASADQMPVTNINNLALLGNAKKSENSSLSGGIIGIKALGSNLNVYNNLAQKFYITYFINGARGENYYKYNVTNLVKTNIYDAYNTILYMWGAKEFNIDGCHLIGAGGPVMICDHVDNDEQTGEGGYTTNVYIDKKNQGTSVLESWVAGTEGWFETYQGSGALAQQIKGFSQLYELKGKTLLDGSKINLICVYKSGDAEGLTTSLIRGTFNSSDCEYDFNIHNEETYVHIAKQVGLYELVKAGVIAELVAGGHVADATQATAYVEYDPAGIALLNSKVVEYTRQYASQGVFLVTDSGSVGFPGTEGWYTDERINGEPNNELLAEAEKYMYIYLFNGMGAVIGIEDYQAS